MLKVFFIRLIMRVFYLFPVKRNKIFFSSFEGKSIACNPKYIYLYLKEHLDNLQYVWEYNGKDISNIKTVKHNSLGYMYHIMTSKIIITNTGLSSVFPLRKGQKCINTWHGSGAYKKVGKDVESSINGTSDYRMKLSNKSTDYFISGCESFTQAMSGAIMLEKEKFLPTGMPRNDYLISGDLYDNDAIKRRANLPPDKKIVLYAPTFRGATGQALKDDGNIDVQRLLSALSQKFGGQWIFAYRCHYHVKSTFTDEASCIDLSQYDDMQELLSVSDILITDYSSSIWDFSFTKRPCFLYCYDLCDYEKERDFYVPIEEWGFPIAITNDELIAKINEFQADKYLERIEEHHSSLGSYGNGKATETISEVIKGILEVQNG